jgi:cyclic-di-GMP phosphodiesterase TipF (flagellum assembly factor)
VSEAITFLFTEAEWFDLNTRERGFIAAFARKGVTYSVSNLRSLRIDVAAMAEMGVRSVRVDATLFTESPQTYTDFHLNDVAAYLARHDITLIATGVVNERQIVELLDNDIVLVQGDHVAKAGSIRSDLTLSSGRATRAV